VMRHDCRIDRKPVAFLSLDDLQPAIKQAVRGKD
jgi:hypothetical protein